MRKKSVKVDHHITDASLDDDFSDYDSPLYDSPQYDSPQSDHHHMDVDVDVKEALRSSICLKSKLQRLTSHNSNMSNKQIRHDTLKTARPTSLDLAPQTKKEKKSKKPEDVETAVMRRERNRLAAQRCRQRRRDRIDKLEKICDKLQNEGDKFSTEISDLQNEMNNLQKILSNHKCMAVPTRVKRENYAFDTKYDTRIVS